MLDAIEDWQLSSRESLTDLLFTEGQSRETYDIATSNVYANWENGVGNLLGDKPEGTGWEKPETPIGTDSKTAPNLDNVNQHRTFDETTDGEQSTSNDNDSPTRPGTPSTWKYNERTWIGAITEETGSYFYNYGYYLGFEVYTAGTTITETGAAMGDAIGEHGARLYYDPNEEFNVLVDSATTLYRTLKTLEQKFMDDPIGSLHWAGNASVAYLDDLTSNPETSGKLLGNVAILWATTGATGGTSTYLRSLFGATKAAQAAGAAGTTGSATSTTSQAANVARKVAGEVEDVLDKVEDVVDDVPVPKNVDAPDVPNGALKELVDETPDGLAEDVLDPELLAQRRLLEYEGNTAGTHFLQKHSPLIDDAALRQRAIDGKLPWGGKGKPFPSSKFHSYVDMLDAFERAMKHYHLSGVLGKKIDFVIPMFREVGYGYLKGGTPRVVTELVVARFDEFGRLFTLFPKIN
jgi:hypothetical protein